MFNSEHLRSSILATLLSTAMASPAMAADLTVTIGPITKAKGDLMVAVFNSEATFREDAFTTQRAKATKGDVVLTFPNLDAGEYAVMVIHDVNSNNELDTNLLGLPSEPWGGSLQGKRIFGAPKWDDTRFSIADTDVAIAITLN